MGVGEWGVSTAAVQNYLFPNHHWSIRITLTRAREKNRRICTRPKSCSVYIKGRCIRRSNRRSRKNRWIWRKYFNEK